MPPSTASPHLRPRQGTDLAQANADLWLEFGSDYRVETCIEPSTPDEQAGPLAFQPKETQEEFFHTFNAMHEGNRQLVLSSDRPGRVGRVIVATARRGEGRCDEQASKSSHDKIARGQRHPPPRPWASFTRLLASHEGPWNYLLIIGKEPSVRRRGSVDRMDRTSVAYPTVGSTIDRAADWAVGSASAVAAPVSPARCIAGAVEFETARRT